MSSLLHGLFVCASWVLHLERGVAHSLCVYGMPQCSFQMELWPGALKNPCLCHHTSGLPQGALSPKGAVTQHTAEGLWGSCFPNLFCIAPHPSQLNSLHRRSYITQVRYFSPSNILQTSESVNVGVVWCAHCIEMVEQLLGHGLLEHQRPFDGRCLLMPMHEIALEARCSSALRSDHGWLLMQPPPNPSVRVLSTFCHCFSFKTGLGLISRAACSAPASNAATFGGNYKLLTQ